MRRSHIVAAFVGVMLAGWLMYSGPERPGYKPPNPVVLVAWVGVTSGLLWECALRAWEMARNTLWVALLAGSISRLLGR